ncbi:MAG: hypothetical protein ACYC0H_15580 [Solirubrobacteraceae bacterium]
MTKLFTLWLAWRALRALVAIALVVALVSMVLGGRTSPVVPSERVLTQLRHEARPLERSVQRTIEKVLQP